MLTLWKRQADCLSSLSVADPIQFGDGELTPWLAPLDGKYGSAAALLVPDVLHRQVARDGLPLAAGLHLLRHAERVDFLNETYWVAVSATLANQTYDPDVHGDDIFCFITKARLQKGESIVVCPGTSGSTCGIIYKEAAWEMARAATHQFRCPQCGFDPAAGQWKPTLPEHGSLDRLLALVDQYRPTGEG